MSSREFAKTILAKNRDRLLRMKDVQIIYTGTKIKDGRDTGEPAIVIGVKKKHGKLFLKLTRTPLFPSVLGTPNSQAPPLVPTDVVSVGILKSPPEVMGLESEDDPAEHKKKFRPKIPGGVSAIVCGSSACTTTCWVWSNYLKKGLLLDNWHCAKLGACPDEMILQPSPYDGGTLLFDKCAKYDFGNIENPLTDSGISIGLKDEHATMQILGLGSYKGTRLPDLGDEVIKSGRTSGVTRGTVVGLDGSAFISYPDKIREKHDLIVTSYMLDGGDSSSPLMRVVNNVIQPELCGQGFAGSSQMSLHIKMSNIIKDPAFGHYQLDFDHEIDTPEPPPPPPEKSVLLLATAKKLSDGKYDIETVWFEIPLSFILADKKE